MKLFVNGRILATGGSVPVDTGIAVRGGEIVAVGPDRTIRAMAGQGDEIVDLEGAHVLPGFHDSHVHLSTGAVTLARLDLKDASSAEDAATRVADRARTVAWGSWVRGSGWDHTSWRSKGWPDRSILDATASDHPVVLSRVDGHVGWLNSLALRALGIDRSTPDPPGGIIVRDANGEPTGILIETAWEAARDRVPRESRDERLRSLERALAELRRLGITAVHDITDADGLSLLSKLRDEGKLTARVAALLPVDLDPEAAEELRRSHPLEDPWIAAGTLKIFLDGTLGSRSAALLAPYADDPRSNGLLRIPAEELDGMVAESDARGWAVAIHAIGDLSVRTALDAFERLPRREGTRPHRIEHAQVVTADDLSTFARLGVVASVQPVHFTEDLPWIAERLGERGGARIYPLRSLLESGAILTFGTDWPIAPLDPWLGIVAATGRNDGPGAGEGLSLGDALRAYTVTPAWVAGRHDSLGTLARGFRADFIVLRADWEEVILDGGRPDILSTYVDGNCVHDGR